MTATAFVIGLLLGLIIGYFLGKQASSKSDDTKSPNHNLSDSDINKINDDLLLEGGKYQVQTPSGETIRYISFIDALLLDLNQSNNDLIVDHCKNLDSAVRILEQAQKDKNPDFPGYSTAERARIETQIKNGEPFEFDQFSKICPPPTIPPKENAAKFLWGPVAMKVIANSTPKITADISLKDPNGKILEVKNDGVVYDFGDTVVAHNVNGIYTILFKIHDLELGKTSSFEQLFAYEAEDR